MPVLGTGARPCQPAGSWVKAFRSLCQGNLDMKYLATRYQNGKQFVEGYLTEQNRYVELAGGLSDAHGDLLKMQTDQGAGSNAPLCDNPPKVYGWAQVHADDHGSEFVAIPFLAVY